jgi:VWFA-related protein
LILDLFVVLLVSLASQQVGGAQQADQVPPFRSGVELVRIPVRVLDNKGRFVRDLARDEFRIFEDGTPQPIATFDLIESGPANSGSPTTKGAESADAPSESSLGMRTYVLLVDDDHLRPDDGAKAKSVVQTFLRQHTTADDRVAIVFTSGATGQDLTSDGSLLISALDRLRGQFDPNEPAGIREMKALRAVTAVRDISRDLAGQGTALRRAIVLFSPGVGCAPAALPSSSRGQPWCGTGMTDTLRAAAGGNVTVFAIDPRGSRNPAWQGTSAESPGSGTRTLFQSRNGVGGPGSNFLDAMHVLASETGGFSIATSENFTNAFERITLEMSQYYLLGYYPAHTGAGDSIHQNEIRVSRSGTKTFYRRTYLASR